MMRMLTLLLLLSGPIAIHADEIKPLLNRTHRIELKDGIPVVFRLDLAAGHFASLLYEPEGTVMTVRVEGPGAKPVLARLDHLNEDGKEPVSWVAGEPGTYRIVFTPAALKGSHHSRFTLLASRPGSLQDQDLLRAESALVHALGHMFEHPPGPVKAKKLKDLEEAAGIWRIAGVRVLQAESLRLLGMETGRESDVVARQKLEEARAIFSQLDMPADEAEALNSICVNHLVRGVPADAVEPCRKALELGAGTWPSREASYRGNYCAALGESGYGRDAVPQCERALALSRQAGEGVDSAQSNLGALHAQFGNYDRALECLRQALPLRKDAGDRARNLALIGEVYYLLNDDDKAAAFINQSLDLAREAKDRYQIASGLNLLGLVRCGMSRCREALPQFDKALAELRQLGHPRMESNTLSSKGTALFDLRRFEEAEQALQEALRLQRKEDLRRGMVTTLAYLTRIALQASSIPAARAYCLEALQLSRETSDTMREGTLLGFMAEIELASANLAGARKLSLESIATRESIRWRLANPAFRATFASNSQKNIEAAARVFVASHRAQPDQGFDAKAFEIAEHGRARSLLETLSVAKADSDPASSPELFAKAIRLRERADVLAQQAGPKQRLELTTVLAEYRETESLILAANPRQAALSPARPASVAQVQQRMTQGELLLEYVAGEQNGYLFALTKQHLAVFELPAQKEIDDFARRYRHALAARGERPKAESLLSRTKRLELAEREAAEAGTALSKIVFGRVVALAKGKRLLLVPSASLEYVPFGALTIPGAALPLAMTNEFVLLPSASVFALGRSNPIGRRKAPKQIAVLADPVFSAHDPRLTKSGSAFAGILRTPESADDDAPDTRLVRALGGANSLDRLASTRREAEGIAAVAKRGRLVALDFLASRATALRPEMRDYEILHFATHGYVDSVQPELSGIVLSLFDSQGRAQDGVLRPHHIYNMRLNASLVVLSGCETALGRQVRGEGPLGLSRAFMHAGASQVLASLWKVEDEATAELMGAFYRALLVRGQSTSAALRAAQVHIRNQPKWRHPYYWAAFALQGDSSHGLPESHVQLRSIAKE